MPAFALWKVLGSLLFGNYVSDFFSFFFSTHTIYTFTLFRTKSHLNVPGIPVRKPLQINKLLINKKDKNSRYTNIKIIII